MKLKGKQVTFARCNISVHGTLEALYRSKGKNNEGEIVAAIGFSANKDGTDNVATLEISGLYNATLKFIYKPTGIQDSVTVQAFDAKMLGADGMFTGGDKSRIEFHSKSLLFISLSSF